MAIMPGRLSKRGIQDNHILIIALGVGRCESKTLPQKPAFFFCFGN